MSATVVAGIGFILASLALVTWSVISSRPHGRASIQENLSRGLVVSRKPVKRGGNAFESLAGRFTPRMLVANLDRQLALAGRGRSSG
jgi:hypothetical protein